MRAIRVASAALLGVGALAFSAAPAAANDGGNVTPFGFSVLPTTIAAGGQITFRLDRDSGGCKGSVTVSSAVFDTVTIPRGRSSGTATVDVDAKATAVYQVTFSCDGMSGSTDLTIAGGRPVGPTPVPINPANPDRGVHAGEGGSVAGFDLREIGLGAALITGSVGAAYHFSRRRGHEDGA
ncbi:hypothetical protein PO587_06765 [Streptomyces gilvifuscus]|uniref:Lipoprotein n=1 Tax=Streptomyces gilvifuscus TaxID=1550617 RepID=A0ABT5FNV4_9ACTN|nr:hypothetical protein [Streptomyces gilvifuscus]MDC2954152.1 hypothetical protein [Streptomyces gilvifuscus]